MYSDGEEMTVKERQGKGRRDKDIVEEKLTVTTRERQGQCDGQTRTMKDRQ